jgi:dihydrofolate reductase
MLFSIILACTLDGGIGYNNDLAWDIKNELKLFKKISEGNHLQKKNVIIMGRKTFFSINQKPLKNRINIVISNNYSLKHDYSNLLIFSTIDMALKYCEINCNKINKVFVIGGKSIYDLCLEDPKLYNNIENIYLSIVYKRYLCDIFIDLKKILKNFTADYKSAIFDPEFLHVIMKNKFLL